MWWQAGPDQNPGERHCSVQPCHNLHGKHPRAEISTRTPVGLSFGISGYWNPCKEINRINHIMSIPVRFSTDHGGVAASHYLLVTPWGESGRLMEDIAGHKAVMSRTKKALLTRKKKKKNLCISLCGRLKLSEECSESKRTAGGRAARLRRPCLCKYGVVCEPKRGTSAPLCKLGPLQTWERNWSADIYECIVHLRVRHQPMASLWAQKWHYTTSRARRSAEVWSWRPP